MDHQVAVVVVVEFDLVAIAAPARLQTSFLDCMDQSLPMDSAFDVWESLQIVALSVVVVIEASGFAAIIEVGATAELVLQRH